MADSRIEKYIAVTPSERQKAYQEAGFHAFIHYGMNTFTGKEWGDGKASPELFNPAAQDTDQWAAALKDAGVKGIILTAKHHDGFCLWQTKTTEYSVKNSPYKDGKGDVVREVSDSCKKYGLKFGVYLSPWDRNSEYYATEKYNDFYIEQLTELLTEYGEIFCVWLDGACGSHMDGKPKQVYDFARIYETVRRLQPNACISNCGPDVRWVGNEGGYARESEWNVVPKFSFNTQNIENASQQGENDKMQSTDTCAKDIGSRKALEPFDKFIWYPAEVDVSIRPGWFWHASENNRLRSLNNLLNIYYTSVCGNSLLLLNVPPTTEGKIHENDVKRLKELGDGVKAAFAKPVSALSVKTASAAEGFAAENVLTDDETCFTPEKEAENYELCIKFNEAKNIDKVLLREQCDFSQRVEAFEIYASLNGNEKQVCAGTIIGFGKLAIFKKPVLADGVRIVVTECRSKPCISFACAYEANGGLPQIGFFEKAWNSLVKMGYSIGSAIYLANEARKNKKVQNKK